MRRLRLRLRSLVLPVLAAFSMVAAVVTVAPPAKHSVPLIGTANAACSPTAPPTTNGTITQSVSVTTAGTYRLWSRMKAASASANSYYFQIDGGCAYSVGGSSALSTTAWSWVSYQDGASNSPIDVTLSAGTHTLAYTGKNAAVQLDKLMLLADTGCVPVNIGDNCGEVDIMVPIATITAPAVGKVLTGPVAIKADASDTQGVVKVEFYVNGFLKFTDTTAPYVYDVDTHAWANAQYTLTARAYDSAGNTGTSKGVTLTTDNDPEVSPSNNLLSGKTFTSSVGVSTTEPGNPLTNINDKNERSRWISVPADNATLATDLGASYTLGKVSILWAADTVKDYEIQTSPDNSTWKTVATSTTNNSQRQLIDTTSFSQTPTGRYFRIVAKNRWNSAFGNSIFEVGAYVSATNPTLPPALAPDGGTYMSDLRPTFTTNSWGPYEKDKSNGEDAAGDGKVLTMQGVTYAKGLGTHAAASLTYELGGTKSTFKADIGIDDEAGNVGSVQFEVYGDGRQLYQSTVKTGLSPVESISVDVRGVKELKLVDNMGADNGNDHADWANARVLPSSGTVLIGDINGDKRVNAIDLSVIISRDGQNYPAADFNKDGTVGAADLAILLSKWTW